MYGAWIEVYSNREGGTKEPHSKRLTIKETSKNRLTARESGNTKEPDILVSERPAPINESKDGNPSIKQSMIRQPRATVSTKEHSTKRATTKEHSNNGSTAQPSDSKVPKTKDPGPNGHTPGILAAERSAPINGPKKNNPSIQRSVIRRRRAAQLITREPSLQAVSSKQR